MREERFDDMLRDALAAAALEEFALSGPAPDWSPAYRRDRMRRLADPEKWYQARKRPVWRRALRQAACLLLVLLLSFGSLLAASPAVRAAVLGWLRELRGNEFSYTYQAPPAQTAPETPPPSPAGTAAVPAVPPDPAEAEPPALTAASTPSDAPEPAAPLETSPAALFSGKTTDWAPTWLPEGWGLSTCDTSASGFYELRALGGSYGDTQTTRTYRSGGRTFRFACFAPEDTEIIVNLKQVSVSDAYAPETVWGRPADFYAYSPLDTTWLFWEADGLLFELSGNLDRATLKQVAESVAVCTASLPDHQMGWTPEGAVEVREPVVLPGAVERVWASEAERYSVYWLYTAETVETPAGTPEEVTVNGVPGRYWVPTDPEGPGIRCLEGGGSGVSFDDSIPIRGPGEFYIPGDGQKGTLVWTDPATGVTHRLYGCLDRDSLLRMAESVTAK